MELSWISARIEAKSEAAEDIRVLDLVSADGASLPTYSAGAHIDLEIRPGLIRQYSLCEAPEGADFYRIAVLKDPSSRGGSIAVHEALTQGQVVRIRTPRNHFELVEGVSESILLAGGIGITPLLSMADHLHAKGEGFHLHYCARSRSKMAFADRLASGAYADRVSLYLDDEPEQPSLDLKQALGQPAAGRQVYVCGPTGFIDWVFKEARALGWPDSQLKREYFSADEPVQQDGDESFVVQINSTGARYEVPAGRAITQVLAEQGIEIPVSCQQGVCGTCITKVLQGEPDHRDLVLMGDEMDEIAPCCSRSKTPVLVLDL